MRVSAFAGIILSQIVMVSGWAVRAEDPAGAPGHPLFQVHSAGWDAVSRNPDLGSTQRILALAPSQELFRQTWRRLALSMPEWYGAERLDEAHRSTVLDRLAEALLRSEAMAEVREMDGGGLEWAIAVRFNHGEAGAMVGDLGAVMAGLSGEEAAKPGPAGWEIEVRGRRVARGMITNEWVVTGCGAVAVAELASRAGGSGLLGGGSNELVRLRADLGRLTRNFGGPAVAPGPVAQWPVLEWNLSARKGGIRTTGTIEYAEPHGLVLEAWKVPKHLVREPLISFTAIQGAGDWLKRSLWGGALGIEEWPRQAYVWTIGQQPWLQYAAAPSSDPEQWVRQAGRGPLFSSLTNWLGSKLSLTLSVTNDPSRIEMRGLPFFSPFLEAKESEHGSVVLAGLFPLAIPPDTVPDELFSQVEGRTNLLIYDWETTGRALVFTNVTGRGLNRTVTNRIGRLMQLTQLAQFLKMVEGSPVPQAGGAGGQAALDIPGQSWIDGALPVLGDAVTEVTVTGPRHLSMTRQSGLGLNSWEILAFLRWLDNPAFPRWAKETRGASADDGTAAH